eukprot:1158871-Pelagomonas_calceolata.AAC.7
MRASTCTAAHSTAQQQSHNSVPRPWRRTARDGLSSGPWLAMKAPCQQIPCHHVGAKTSGSPSGWTELLADPAMHLHVKYAWVPFAQFPVHAQSILKQAVRGKGFDPLSGRGREEAPYKEMDPKYLLLNNEFERH